MEGFGRKDYGAKGVGCLRAWKVVFSGAGGARPDCAEVVGFPQL